MGTSGPAVKRLSRDAEPVRQEAYDKQREREGDNREAELDARPCTRSFNVSSTYGQLKWRASCYRVRPHPRMSPLEQTAVQPVRPFCPNRQQNQAIRRE